VGMRVLLLGSGGREHALAWALARSAAVEALCCAPGSAGIAADAQVRPLELGSREAVLALAREWAPDLVVIGPEAPLASGFADALRERGLAVFGPSGSAARLESSKIFAKEFMRRHGVPTAPFAVFAELGAARTYVRERGGPCVVKADGLAAGKGVFVCDGPAAALAALAEIMEQRRFGAAGARVLIEERLEGEEASFYAICDGTRFVCLPAAQDFKRALDGDGGENTGGMGSLAPAPVVTAAVRERVIREIVAPVLAGMRAEGHPFQGVLYVGLMVRDGVPQVIEFNARFGDPETQPLLFGLREDLAPLLAAAARGALGPEHEKGLDALDPSVCVVLASPGYPRAHASGVPIRGLEALAGERDVKVFHAGTRLADGVWQSAGGRVLGVTARGATLASARERAYAALGRIEFAGAHYRRDIAERAAASRR
jgi:phosphoribosylamine--glycine ligase